MPEFTYPPRGVIPQELMLSRVGWARVLCPRRSSATFPRGQRVAHPTGLFGRKVHIAAIEDLLVMKRIANRPKDQIDIMALEKIVRGEDPNA